MLIHIQYILIHVHFFFLSSTWPLELYPLISSSKYIFINKHIHLWMIIALPKDFTSIILTPKFVASSALWLLSVKVYCTVRGKLNSDDTVSYNERQKSELAILRIFMIISEALLYNNSQDALMLMINFFKEHSTWLPLQSPSPLGY